MGGFFALSPSLISPKSVAGSLRGGINRQPIPAYLIGRVGVRTDLQGKGLGTALIHEALGIIMRVARETGGRLVLIDAKSEELASWYEHLGFRRLTDSPLRLVMKIHSIERVLANV
ncbi:GNAT family N-acetyltransferase [Collinsella intestinalis]|uniref:GNAT family N-acetyltransferase n=1 Tax=Collinsella intestinalis TaxID=147207 RepID=UPI00195DA76F|nr:GNAT family N-acetyltransferase [Collinsella intestinalis]MBM6942989.1 GNAT family N-acetyltransferase [Collinsella intestinalis]